MGFNHKIISLTIYSIQFLSQLRATMADPGVPHKNNYVSEEVIYTMYQHMKINKIETIERYNICKECNIVVKQEQYVVHCNDCEICIEGNN
jgi:hypothetical protein